MEQCELYGLNVVGVANFVHRRVSQMIDLWLQILCFFVCVLQACGCYGRIIVSKKKKKDATSMGACTANPSADSL
jgi:hypothetical protein